MAFVRCITSSHCRPTCQSCSQGGQICLKRRLRPCTADEQCGPGNTCDGQNGQCIRRPELTYSGGCQIATRSSGDVSAGGASGSGLVMSLAWLLGLFLLLRRASFRRASATTRRTILALAALLGVSHAPAAAQAETLAFNAPDAATGDGAGGRFRRRRHADAQALVAFWLGGLGSTPTSRCVPRCQAARPMPIRPRHVHGAPYPRVGLARFCVGGYRYSAGPLPGL